MDKSINKESNFVSCKAVLLDIEGTTTSVSFVKDVLFPYVVDNVEEHLLEHWNQNECMKDVSGLREQAAIDVADNISGVSIIPATDNEDCKSVRESVVRYVKLLVSEDRKVTSLKDLQGHMWRQAYKAGRIKGHVYSDVPVAMASWFKKRIKMYIYSSGSVEAQKLLFGNSVAGDLLKYISGHFDTKTGDKRQPSSYTKIAKEIGMQPSQILFLTDVVQGMVCIRSNGPLFTKGLKLNKTIVIIS